MKNGRDYEVHLNSVHLQDYEVALPFQFSFPIQINIQFHHFASNRKFPR